MFNLFEWGGYLGYTLNGASLVFIDSRIQPFLGTTISDYLSVIGIKDGWEDILAKYKIGRIVISASSALATKLAVAQGWKLDFQDDQTVIFDRQDCELEDRSS